MMGKGVMLLLVASRNANSMLLRGSCQRMRGLTKKTIEDLGDYVSEHIQLESMEQIEHKD